MLLFLPLQVARGEADPAWERPSAIPAESDFFRDRLEEPQNHFLLDGQQGFVSGREFYQSAGEAAPFLWTAHPFLHYGSDRGWQSDTLPVVFHAWLGNEVGEPFTRDGTEPAGKTAGNWMPLTDGDVGWSPLTELRLHAGLDQNGEFSHRTFPSRLALVGEDNRDRLSWVGGNLPPKSQVNVGGAFDHRGASLAAQYNQGWWWTASPVSGQVYPWEGFNSEILYRMGDDFELSLVDQEWDSPAPRAFYDAHWRRSELDMSFLGSSEGAWIWRLDLGFQRRQMFSDSVFAPFLEKTYPTRFRYRQNWAAPDSLPLRMISQGSMGFRDRIISLQHSSEFTEQVGTHVPREILKGYYHYVMEGYKVPTEAFPQDSTWTAKSIPGLQSRGLSGELEYREKRKAFEVGASVNYVMEWEAPLFHLQNLDTLDGAVVRAGEYAASDYLLQNASAHVFAEGGVGAEKDSSQGRASWRLQAGWRDFWGRDARAMEFRPSREWAGAGGGWDFPWDLKLAAQVNWVGEKEVRGWGPVFKVPSHLENNVSLTQSLLNDKLKLSFATLHAFGKDIREQPNGNPLRFRILAGIEGAF